MIERNTTFRNIYLWDIYGPSAWNKVVYLIFISLSRRSFYW